MIWIDEPRRYQRPNLLRGRPFTSSHMFSDLSGEEGSKELVEFGHRIGQKREWLQRTETWLEHFDVMNTRYRVAVSAGARECDSEKALEIWRRKKNDHHRI